MAPATATATATAAAAGLLAVFLLVAPLSAQQQLPAGFKRCPKNDAAFSTCMVDAIPAALQQLAPGVSEMGLPPLDPLHIPQFTLSQADASSPVNLNVTLKDINIYGLRNALASDITSNLGKYEMSARGHVPQLYVDADYVMDGRVLVIPITGAGRVHANITMLHAQIAQTGEENVKDGRSHMRVNTFSVDIYNIENLAIQFDNLFNGDPALGASANKLLNENWQGFWEELRPPMEETLRGTLLQYSRRIFDRVPYDDAFEN